MNGPRRPALGAIAIVWASLWTSGCTETARLPPGGAALERLGATEVDLIRPPSYDQDAGALDALGPTATQQASQPVDGLEVFPPFPDSLEVLNGDGPLRISVEQAVFIALRNNRALSVQQLNPVIAGTFEEIERAVFDPVIFADGEIAEEEAQQMDPATESVFSIQGEDSIVSGGVLQRLPTGTAVELFLTQDRIRSNRTPEQYGTRVGVTLTQALLRGADIEANLARIRQAEVDTLSTVYELRGFAEALVAEVEFTYWDLALAQGQIEIFEEALAVARQQLAETRRRIDVGQLPETELAAAQAEVALREQDLIDARSNLEKTRLRLLQLLNPASEAGWSRRIEPTDAPDIAEVPLDHVEDRLALALRLRPDLNQARLDVERGRLEVVRTKNGLLPVLDLFITLGKTGFADSFGRSISSIDGPGYDLAARLQFEFPAGNRQAKALYRGALATREQAAKSLENLAQLVSLDVRTAYVEARRAREQIAASGATRALQEEVLRAEQVKFRVGNSTAFAVAQAQRDLLESQIDEIEAIVAYRKALIDLYRLEGSFLKRRGIDAPGAQLVNASVD